MEDAIRFSVELGAVPEVVASALREARHLRRWWTRELEMEGSRVRARWHACGPRVELEIADDPDRRRVVWNCLGADFDVPGPAAWEGRGMSFDLAPTADGCRLDFFHTACAGMPCREDCMRDWDFLLGTSLKRYLENGRGLPYPESAAMRAEAPD